MKLSKPFLFVSSIFLQSILFMPGCKIIDWGKDNFKQAERYDKEVTKEVSSYIKSTIVYDQLATIANFDALFLTDRVRMLYVDYYTNRHVLSHERESIMRHRLLNENKYYISFYVLGSQDENMYESSYALFAGEYKKRPSLLGEKDSEWQISMQVGDKLYAPDVVRVVELPIEYQHLFGSRCNQFQSAYLVRFDFVDQQDQEIFSKGEYDVSLYFTSARYKTKLEWHNISYFK